MNNPKIRFDTLKLFKKYCKTNKIVPEIEYRAMKHQNMRGEFLHEVTGSFLLVGIKIDYIIEELVAFTNKKALVS